MSNPWVRHCKQYQIAYGCSYKDAMQRSRPSYRAATRSEHTSKNFVPGSFTLNENLRPLRAIVSGTGVQKMLPITERKQAKEFLLSHAGTPHAKGKRFDKKGNAVHRTARSIDVETFKAFLTKYVTGKPSLDTFENHVRDTVLGFYPNGVSYQDKRHKGKVYDRTYTPSDYVIIFAGIFEDPPGSSEQNTHADVGMADRDALWNIVFPLELHDPYVMAQSMAKKEPSKARMQADQATMWDAGWAHRGLGNPTHHKRVLLHLALAPYWFVVPTVRPGPPASIDWREVSKSVRERLERKDGVDLEFFEHLHNGDGHAHTKTNMLKSSISKEYNNGVGLSKTKAEMRSWIERARTFAKGKR